MFRWIYDKAQSTYDHKRTDNTDKNVTFDLDTFALVFLSHIHLPLTYLTASRPNRLPPQRSSAPSHFGVRQFLNR